MILGMPLRKVISGAPGRHTASLVDWMFVGFALLGMVVCLLSVLRLQAGASRNVWTKDEAMRLRRWVNNRSLSLYAFVALCAVASVFFTRSGQDHLGLIILPLLPLQVFLAVDRCLERVVSPDSSTVLESAKMLPLKSEHWGEPRPSDHRLSQ